MAIQQDATAGGRREGLKDTVVRTTSAAGAGIGQLTSGLSTALPALLVLLRLAVTAAASLVGVCLLYTSPSPRDLSTSRMPSSA